MGYSPRSSSIHAYCTMSSLTLAVMVVVFELTQGTSPPVPAPAPAPVPRPAMYRPPYRPSPFGGFGGGIDPTTLLLLGGGLGGGSSSSTDSLLPLLLLGGGGLGGGKPGYGGHGGLGGGLGGINPLMLSLLSCKEPVADCQKPNEGTTLCGKGAAKVCCTCNGGGLFGL